jgi:hypothetical protein
MVTVYAQENELPHQVFIKGSTAVVLDHCTKYIDRNGLERVLEEDKKIIIRH